LSIAQSVFDVIHAIEEREGQMVTAAVVEIGELSGVVAESLEFCLPMAAEAANHTEIIFTLLSGSVRTVCQECGFSGNITAESIKSCPGCGSEDMIINGGRDILLKEVTLN